MATAWHTALLVKALSAGQAVPGVICGKQTKSSALLLNRNSQAAQHGPKHSGAQSQAPLRELQTLSDFNGIRSAVCQTCSG